MNECQKFNLQLRNDWIQALSHCSLGDVDYLENCGGSMRTSDGKWNVFGVLTDVAIRYYGYQAEWLPSVNKYNTRAMRLRSLQPGAADPLISVYAPPAIALGVGLKDQRGQFRHPRIGVKYDLARVQDTGMQDLRFDHAQLQFVKEARNPYASVSFPEFSRMLRRDDLELWVGDKARKEWASNY